MQIQQRIDNYINGIESGTVKASKLTRLSVQRHLKDLEAARDRGLYFDIKAAERICKFFPLMNHHKGAKGNKPFELLDWQVFYLSTLFGWKRENGTRRFRKSYLEIARKNGKTTLCAGKSLYAAKLDGEVGAQVYFVATKEDQAKIGFNDAKMILKNSPAISKHYQSLARSVYIPADGSFIKPLGSDSDTQDGLDPSYVIVDEYHAHPNDKMLNVMETGMGARRQPMVDIITTAGFNKEYPCFGFRKMVQSILEGDIHNDSIFGLIYTLDDVENEWQNPDEWIKANPCFGESVYMDNLLDFFTEAKTQGGEKEVEFKTKHLNLWVDAAKTWITTELWDRSGTRFNETDLNGMRCYGGLDLASVEDFASFSLLFPLDNGSYKLLTWFWIPEDTVKARVKKGLTSLRDWIDKGYVFVTPGNTIDYDYIEKFILQKKEQFDIISIAFDRWNSLQMVTHLTNESIEMSPFGQGYASMSTPIKQFKKLILESRLDHGHNPVLRWQRGNVVISIDPAQNEKPDKAKSSEKIDGIASGTMAIGEYLTKEGEQDAYASGRGLLII